MDQLSCQNCGEQFQPPRKRFCSKRCAVTWHNARQPSWAERPAREEYNAEKKARYAADPTAAAARMRKWRAENPERQKAIEKRRRENHGPALRERCRAWHAENSEAANANRSRWHDEHREYANTKRRQHWNGARVATPWFYLLHSAKARAKAKSLPFDLDDEWGAARWTGLCELTKLPFNLAKGRRTQNLYSPSIDRVKPELGYVKDNCRFVIFSVNAMKYDGSDNDMLSIARALLQYYQAPPPKL